MRLVFSIGMIFQARARTGNREGTFAYAMLLSIYAMNAMTFMAYMDKYESNWEARGCSS